MAGQTCRRRIPAGHPRRGFFAPLTQPSDSTCRNDHMIPRRSMERLLLPAWVRLEVGGVRVGPAQDDGNGFAVVRLVRS